MDIKFTKFTRLRNVLGAFLFILATGSSLLAQVNILNTNGSFEDTAPGPVSGRAAKGWVLSINSAISPAPAMEVVNTTSKSGNNSLMIAINGVGSDAWTIEATADSIPAVNNKRYKYSIWAKAATSGAAINITIGNYAYNEYGSIRPADLTTEWKEFTFEFTVSDNQSFIRGPIHFSISGNVGNTIFIDDLRINDVEDVLKPLIVEAESGIIGNAFTAKTDSDSTKYVDVTTNLINGGNPGSAQHVISYQVTFPDTGNYNLFARIKIGADGFNDDSFFYGNGFGSKDTVNDNDWITINGLQTAGFSDSSVVVDESGGLGGGVWKWVNITKNGYQGETGVVFSVKQDSLAQTFQIGSREDGLQIDKFAFGKAYLYYTVKNLDNVEPGSAQLPGEVWEGPPLASKQTKFVGSAYGPPQAPDFEKYWNQVTPENAGKWGSVEGTRDVMNWGGLDAAYNFAKDNGFPFHFHVLIWGAQQPGWISALQPAEQLEEIREWFQAVNDRYPDIDYLEVVNEPLPGHNPPDGTQNRANYIAALGGKGTTGWDWIINAFKMAREIFPAKTRLMLNDFSIINSSTSTSQYLKIIRLLKAENLVDIIAEQGHAFTTNAPVATMKKNLDSLAATGIPIQITELDIDGTADNVQLASYKKIFPALYEHPGVEGITLWGWKPGLWRDDEGAYLILQNGTERAALKWLREYLDTVKAVTGVEVAEGLPKDYQLYNNFPNPFNPTTQIRYNISQVSDVSLIVYDIMGRQIQTLVNEVQSPGQYTVTFNARNLSSGVYFYHLKAGSFVDVKPMMLIK